MHPPFCVLLISMCSLCPSLWGSGGNWFFFQFSLLATCRFALSNYRWSHRMSLGEFSPFVTFVFRKKIKQRKFYFAFPILYILHESLTNQCLKVIQKSSYCSARVTQSINIVGHPVDTETARHQRQNDKQDHSPYLQGTLSRLLE